MADFKIHNNVQKNRKAQNTVALQISKLHISLHADNLRHEFTRE
jgi:hypothetical protein